jgi:predicted secreted protein
MSTEKKPEQTEGLIALDDFMSLSVGADPFAEPTDNGQQGITLSDPDEGIDVNKDIFDLDDTNKGREKQQDSEDIILSNPVSSILAESLLELGIEDFTSVDEVGNEVTVDVKTGNITPEMYKEVLKGYMEAQKEELTKDVIPLKGSSELLRKLAEIDKAGGNISSIIEEKAKVVDPIQSIDITTEKGQEKVIEIFMHAQGRDAEDIEARIQMYKTKGILADKAEEFQGEVQVAFDKYLDQQKQAAEDNKANQKKAIKEYREKFSKGLESFELNDAAKKKLVKFSTEAESDGFLLDKKLREMRLDPEKAARLALFAMDEEEYIKQVTSKVLTQQRQKTAIRIGVAKDKRQAIDNDDLFGSSNSKRSGGLIPIE